MKLNFLFVLIISALLGAIMAVPADNKPSGPPPNGPRPSGPPPNGARPSGPPPGGRGPPPTNSTSSG